MRLLPVAVLLLFSSAASAAPVLFDNRDAFNAAVGASQLFESFDVAYIPGTYDFAGDFGGLRFQHEGTDFIVGQTLGVVGQFAAPTVGLGASIADPSRVRAVGFDLVSASASTPMSWDPVTGIFSFPQPIPTTFEFGFRTLAGEFGTHAVTPGSFFGLLTYDSAFQFVGLSASSGCICHSSFAIDNLTVAAVPEPMTAILLGLGLLGIAAARRRRLAATR